MRLVETSAFNIQVPETTVHAAYAPIWARLQLQVWYEAASLSAPELESRV